MYSLASLVGPYCLNTTMMCRLFGQYYTHKFTIEWVPLIEVAADAYIMDWATILSNNLATQILAYKSKYNMSTREIPPFFMSAYIMDALCLTSDFPSMGWKWTL